MFNSLADLLIFSADRIALVVVYLLALYFFFAKPRETQPRLFLWLIYSAVGIRVLYAIGISIAQYFYWSQDQLGRLFLDDRAGGVVNYFLPYALARFWFGRVFLVLLFGVLFYLLVRGLNKFNERYFYPGEPQFGVLMTLIVGWPEALIFTLLLAFMLVLVSVVRAIIWHEPYTTLGLPFALAAGLTLIFGSAWVELLHLGVLRI